MYAEIRISTNNLYLSILNNLRSTLLERKSRKDSHIPLMVYRVKLENNSYKEQIDKTNPLGGVKGLEKTNNNTPL